MGCGTAWTEFGNTMTTKEVDTTNSLLKLGLRLAIYRLPKELKIQTAFLTSGLLDDSKVSQKSHEPNTKFLKNIFQLI